MPLATVALAATSLVACVYSSEAPSLSSSGTGTQTTDGTDPGNGDGGGTTSAPGSDGGGTIGPKTDAGTTSPGTDAGTQSKDAGSVSSGPTWTTIYGSYFAAGSMGNCGAGGCHSSSKSGFKCGSDKTTCYNGLVSSGYLTPSTPTSSPIADTQQSCLTWFGGNMPPSGGSSSKAKSDITAWLAAGGQNN